MPPVSSVSTECVKPFARASSSVLLDIAQMSLREHLIESLRHLCQREGGHKAVADRAGLDDQSIYQILTGVKLPSGNAKGVGPTMQRKLDAAFPGWAASAVAPSSSSPGANEDAASYGGAWPFRRLRYSDLASVPADRRDLLESAMLATIAGMSRPDRWRAIAHELAAHMDAELARTSTRGGALDPYTAFVLKVDALANEADQNSTQPEFAKLND